jgi:hypothetical protein
LENMSQYLDFNRNRNLTMQMDAIEEETVLYVKEFFHQLKSSYAEYCLQVKEQLILSEEFKQMYQRILEDQKLLEDIDRDVSTFPKHFVLKENFERYVVQFEKTHDKYITFSHNKLLPEIKLFKNEEFFKKINMLLRDNVHFTNNISELKGNLNGFTWDQGWLTSAAKPVYEREGHSFPARESESYEIDFLHYFQESSKSFHIMKLDRSSLQWNTIELGIAFKIPLFAASIAARKDCIMLVGGVDSVKGISTGEVYVLNQGARTLLKTGELIEPRNNFALVRMNQKIYAVGGCNDASGKLKTCESVNHDS